MGNNRLLSEQEINTIWATRQEGHQTCGDCRDLLTNAQLAKTDKEWVEWANSDCPHVMSATKSRCPDCWANRRKEIGL